MNQQLIDTLGRASADVELFGQHLEKALSRMWCAARDGDANELDDAYGEAKGEAQHLHATMLVVREVMSYFDGDVLIALPKTEGS